MWWKLENESYLIACEKKNIYVHVVWGSTDQAQFWHLVCQTLKNAKKQWFLLF